jgi:gliding motility-associated-like protein
MKVVFTIFALLLQLMGFAQLNGSITTVVNKNCLGTGCNYSGPSILINEIMLSPSPGDGSIWEPNCSSRCSEWIELYNPDICLPIDISCYYLGNNANDGGNYPGGFTIPPGTIVPPRGFVVIRGLMAPPVPPALLVQNGGKTIEIPMSSPNTCIGGGSRLWFPNAGGWFAFYNVNGVAQDAVSWGNQSNLNFSPCLSTVSGCSFNGTLPNYNNIPANRKTMISTQNASNHANQSLRRIPDGGAWAISQPANPTYGNCNAACIPPPIITCTGSATINVTGGTPPYTYLWNDTKMQTTQKADSLCAGNYCVVVRDANNVFASFCVDVKNHLPFVNAGRDTAICLGANTTLNVFGHPTTSFVWNQSLGAGASHTVSPVTSTSYIVTATDTAGCVNKDTVNIGVNIVPVVLGSNSPVCVGDTLKIFENSPPASSYSWTGPNGFSANSQSNSIPNVSQTAQGTYNVSVTINNCSASNSISVLINPLPVITAANNGPVCSGQSIGFSVNGLPGANYQWNGPNGFSSTAQNPIKPNLSHADSGFYYVKVTDNKGCSSKDSTYVSLKPDPNTDFSFLNQCNGTPISFTNNSSISNGNINSFGWDFGVAGGVSNLMNPSYNYISDGFYNVALTAVSNLGCSVTKTKQVQSYALPNPGFSVTPACLNSPTIFTDTSSVKNGHGTLANWYWDFGDGVSSSIAQNPLHVFTTTGIYNIELTVQSSFGCSKTIQVPITVNLNPVSDFSFVSACQDSLISFNSLSTMTLPGTIANYEWNFGNNINGLGLNTNHTYFAGGPFNVKHIVTTTDGCKDSITKSVMVYHKPLTDFTFTDVCSYTTAIFNNTSTIHTSSTIIGYSWNLGDGSALLTIPNPTNNYNTGQYSVSLTATSTEGCSNEKIKIINVFEPPTAIFQVADVCTDKFAEFMNNSIDPSANSIAQYQWDFGNGNVSNQKNPSASYLPGNYLVTMISNIQYSPTVACADTAIGNITIFPLPKPDFYATEACEGNMTDFKDLSMPAADITNWLWDFGNFGGPSILQDPSYLYNGYGIFNASLTVTSKDGCEATIIKQVSVFGKPSAQFVAPEVCLGGTNIFTDVSTVPLPSIIFQWEWEIVDINTNYYFNTKNAQHRFNQVGNYQVKLKVISGNTCTDSITKTVFVNPNPEVNFSASEFTGCSPLCVDFLESATIMSPGQNLYYLWDFGDGGFSTEPNPSYCFINSSNINVLKLPVSLNVVSDKGCSTVLNKADYIAVNPLPFADFYTEPDSAFISKPFMKFFNTSKESNGWQWFFGDGNSMNQFNSDHIYSDTGTYNVLLIAENIFGCLDTSIKSIRILEEFLIYIPNAFTPNNDGTNDYFFPEGSGIIEIEMNIYNRWGEIVYSEKGANPKWDGRQMGKSLQQDVYTYLLNIKHIYQMNEAPPTQFIGKVTLIR